MSIIKVKIQLQRSPVTAIIIAPKGFDDGALQYNIVIEKNDGTREHLYGQAYQIGFVTQYHQQASMSAMFYNRCGRQLKPTVKHLKWYQIPSLVQETFEGTLCYDWQLGTKEQTSSLSPFPKKIMD